MRLSTVSEAMAAAEKFIILAQKVHKRAKEDKYTMYGCRETGALRRASMDLSMLLSDLRQGR